MTAVAAKPVSGQGPQLLIEGKVATITLSRPELANRLGPDDLETLLAHVQTVNARPEVLVLVLQGQGKYFCSGYDIGRIGQGRTVDFETVVNAVEDARPVTIVRLHGPVYGGGTDLSLACDFRIGVPAVEMFMPAARLGLHFYQRGLERYLSRLGLDVAKRLFLTADRIGAEEMRAVGFLTQLVPAEQLDAEIARLSGRLCAMAPLAMLGMKKHLNRMACARLDVEDLKRDTQAAAQSEDLKEGRQAWLEKRAPDFKGR